MDSLEFGFPFDFNSAVLCSTEDNHSSFTQFTSYASSHIQDEIKHGAMLGPLDTKPIQLHVSQFVTREKPDSDVR